LNSVSAQISPKVCPAGNSDCADENDINITWNDECPASCDGWLTYTKSATNFENTSFESFISTTAKTCSDSGCDEFTNLDKPASGGENKEYYSYLRICVKPTDSSVKTFYTWEGSDTAGYQLKKWSLAAKNDGSPKQDNDIGGDTPECLNGADCRDFYSPDNEIYYTIDFTKVIFATEDCHNLRRTLKNDGSPDQKIYIASPSLSKVCSSSNAGCRTYRDNASYNYEIILKDDFENGLNGWTGGGVISNESVKRDGHSLKITSANAGIYNLSDGDLAIGEFYSISVFAKGHLQIVFTLKDGNKNLSIKSIKSEDISDDWKIYKIDFDQITTAVANPLLTIISGDVAYLEEISLKKINNLLAIKDSWSSNQLCKDLGLKEGMTSCSAYKDGLNRTIYLQKFTRLCQEGSVGCEAFLVNGKNGLDWQYLVYDKNKLCSEIGCQKLGELNRDKFEPDNSSKFSYTDKFVVVKENNICQYTDELCVNYKLESGGFGYYRNPKDRICEYKTVNGNYGWFVSGTSDKCPSVDGVGQEKDLGTGTKYCLGGRSSFKDNVCTNNSDCVDYSTFASSGICTSWSGICSDKNSGCQEYQDPFAPEYCDAKLLPNQTENGTKTPCDYYYYTGVESVGSACDETNQDQSQHCFYKTSE
jgi:hypothetical protein